jgi:hypothetical protein
MDNSEKLAILGTQDTRQRQQKQKKTQSNFIVILYFSFRPFY